MAARETKPIDASAADLSVDRIEVLYVSPGVKTTITFKTKKKIDDIEVGSEIVSASWDDDLGVLTLVPRATGGKTNMTVLVGGLTYNFILNIVGDGRVVYSRTYTFSGEMDDQMLAIGSTAPIVRPDEIDTTDLVNTIERALVDKTFAKQTPELYVRPVNRTYMWNNCPVVLKDVDYFPKIDTIVLRIETVNTGGEGAKGIYLHKRQIEVSVANKKIPVTASIQINPMILPGQMDKVYLFIQGGRYNPHAAWELTLPAQAYQVEQMLQSR